MLGRNGDITNLLPVLKQYSLDHNRPARLCVSKDFASLLDGVSYVEPIVWHGSFDTVAEAKAWLYKKFPGHPLVDCSVHGSGVNYAFDMRSFNREIWKRSKTDLPFERAELVFDKRDKAAEEMLLQRIEGKKPLVLFSGAGWTAPFKDAPEVFAELTKRLPGHEVVNVSDVRSTHAYDLLGLYERAVGLVTNDSFPLHLAQAVPTMRTVALIPFDRSPFGRAAWKPYQVLRCFYNEALSRMDEIIRALTHDKPVPELLFVTNYGPVQDNATAARIGRARLTREEEFKNGNWREIRFEAKRDGTYINDKPVPYIRDLLDTAAAEARSDDSILVLCNDDIGFCSGLTGLILETVQRHGAAYAHRWDYHHPLTKRLPKDEFDIRRSKWYSGCDLYAVSKSWWTKHRDMFPDMLMGRESWDNVMRNLMRRNAHVTGCELEHAIWHEWHDSYWIVNRTTSQGNALNRKLMMQWIEQYGGMEEDWRIKNPTYK
jgi:hypothetical protein